ncbi:MAG TPA: DinB family protein [Jatrophihabitans sp.]|jgi:hypothetical protein
MDGNSDAANGLPPNVAPDDKDWTWVLRKRCPECGFEASAISGREVSGIVRDSVPRWQRVLARPDASQRPEPQVWSALEYGCHARDVFTLFEKRAGLMLGEDNPQFANWDQDATALADRYSEQLPTVVAAELAVAGERVARAFDSVRADQWDRAGQRSNGDNFTVESLGQYFVHDVVHHLADVHG